MSSAFPETMPVLWSFTVSVSFAASLGVTTIGVLDEDGAELLCCGLDELLDDELELELLLDEDELLED